jgi:hypothetical protein
LISGRDLCSIPVRRIERVAGNAGRIINAAFPLFAPAHEELIRQAAQGEVVYNDDTTARILELMGQRAEKTPPPEDEHDPNRTGLFTSISRRMPACDRGLQGDLSQRQGRA